MYIFPDDGASVRKNPRTGLLLGSLPSGGIRQTTFSWGGVLEQLSVLFFHYFQYIHRTCLCADAAGDTFAADR